MAFPESRPLRSQQYLPILILGTFAMFGCGGCAAASLATVGTILGAAGSAATTGTEVYSLGKLDFSEWATLDECRAAVTETASDLQLHIIKTEVQGAKKEQIFFRLEDDQKKQIDVRIDRRTAMLCQCRVDVGFFGSEPTAKLIMIRIRSHLPREDGHAALEKKAP